MYERIYLNEQRVIEAKIYFRFGQLEVGNLHKVCNWGLEITC